jgi:hypothetical protein
MRDHAVGDARRASHRVDEWIAGDGLEAAR